MAVKTSPNVEKWRNIPAFDTNHTKNIFKKTIELDLLANISLSKINQNLSRITIHTELSNRQYHIFDLGSKCQLYC